MDTALALCRALHFASAMLLFGASAFRAVRPPVLAAAEVQWHPLFVAASLTALATAVLWFLLVAANMADAPAAMADPQTLRLVLLHTGFGALWIWRLVITVVLVAVSLFARRASALFAILSALLLSSLALTGHAAIGGGWSGFAHRAADATHLLGAGIWLGGLVAVLVILNSSARNVSLHALRRFSDIATPAVALVLATGMINAFFIVPDWRACLASRYGGLLLAKIALAAIMVALALVNRLILTPPLAGGEAAAGRRIVQSVMGELVLGALVLLIAGFLGLTPP